MKAFKYHKHQYTGFYPIKSLALRKESARDDVCPDCGGQLDTGWECVECGYDARDLAYTPAQRELDILFPDS